MSKLLLIVMLGSIALSISIYDLIKHSREETIPIIQKNIIEVEMDKSCYDQFLNNYDKTLYLKLRFEE